PNWSSSAILSGSPSPKLPRSWAFPSRRPNAIGHSPAPGFTKKFAPLVEFVMVLLLFGPPLIGTTQSSKLLSVKMRLAYVSLIVAALLTGCIATKPDKPELTRYPPIEVQPPRGTEILVFTSSGPVTNKGEHWLPQT